MTATATITEIKLPTAESIAALFREHDVLPCQSVYIALPLDGITNPVKCAACALGIQLVEARGSAFRARSHCRQSDLTVKQALKAGTDLPPAFIDGLDDGFTNSNDEDTWEEFLVACPVDDPLYVEGFLVGWQAWELANAGTIPPEHP